MEKQRDTYVDIAKGIAILLVVRIHTEVFAVLPAPYPIVAVPLFFFLSGFYDNTNKHIVEEIKDYVGDDGIVITTKAQNHGHILTK